MREDRQVSRFAPAPLIADRMILMAVAMIMLVGLHRSLDVLLGGTPPFTDWIDRILVWSMVAFLVTGVGIKVALRTRRGRT